MRPEVLEKVCHELEVWEDECISPVPDGMNEKSNRQSDYLRSKGSRFNAADSFRRTSELGRATAGGWLPPQLDVSGRRKQLETLGAYERRFLDSGRRNNGLGPFPPSGNKFGARGMVILWPFRFDRLGPPKE